METKTHLTHLFVQFDSGMHILIEVEPAKAEAILDEWATVSASGGTYVFRGLTDLGDDKQDFNFASSSVVFVRRLNREIGSAMAKAEEEMAQREAARVAARENGIVAAPPGSRIRG